LGNQPSALIRCPSKYALDPLDQVAHPVALNKPLLNVLAEFVKCLIEFLSGRGVRGFAELHCSLTSCLRHLWIMNRENIGAYASPCNQVLSLFLIGFMGGEFYYRLALVIEFQIGLLEVEELAGQLPIPSSLAASAQTLEAFLTLRCKELF